MIALLTIAVFALVTALMFARPVLGFTALFLLRPLVELSRAYPDALPVSTVQLAGIGIPVLILTSMAVRRGMRLETPAPLLLLLVAILVPLGKGGTGALELAFRLATPLPFVLYPALEGWAVADLRKFTLAILGSIGFVFATLVAGWTTPTAVRTAVTIGDDRVLRLAGVFGVPTMTGYWLAIFIGICGFVAFVERDKRVRIAALVSGAILLIPLYATLSRTAWGCIVTAYVAWALLRRSWVGVAAVAFVALATVLGVEGVRGRLFADNFGGTGRWQIWGPAFQAFGDASWTERLLGLGWGNVEVRVRQYVGASVNPVGTGITENSLVYLLLGGGVFALCAQIWFWVWLIRSALPRATSEPYRREFLLFACAMFAMMLTQGMTGDQILSPVLVWYFYALLGVARAANLRPRESIPAPATQLSVATA